MKYTFEVTTRDNENIITVEVGYGSSIIKKIITFEAGQDDDAPSLDELISDMIDNIRLTVKEREDAIYNAKVLKWYLQEYKVNANKVKQQMIVENDDSLLIN